MENKLANNQIIVIWLGVAPYINTEPRKAKIGILVTSFSTVAADNRVAGFDIIKIIKSIAPI
jgi:hypothetical protein